MIVATGRPAHSGHFTGFRALTRFSVTSLSPTVPGPYFRIPYSINVWFVWWNFSNNSKPGSFRENQSLGMMLALEDDRAYSAVKDD